MEAREDLGTTRMVIRTAIDGTYAGLRAAGYIIVSRLMESKLSSFIILRADSNYVERDMVFNVAEGMHGLCREAQVPSLPKAYEIPFTFADAATYNRIVFVKGRTKVDMQSPKWMEFQDKLTDVFDGRWCSSTLASTPLLLRSFPTIRRVGQLHKAQIEHSVPSNARVTLSR